jgi:hypothetical protein
MQVSLMPENKDSYREGQKFWQERKSPVTSGKPNLKLRHHLLFQFNSVLYFATMQPNTKTHLSPILFLFAALVFFHPLDACSQVRDTSFSYHVLRGQMVLNTGEKIPFRTITYNHMDSIRLHREKLTRFSQIGGPSTYSTVPVAQIKLLRENNHALTKGGSFGAVLGFGLGYLAGYLSYEEKFNRTEEENKDRRKNRGTLFGLVGVVPGGIAGALVGGIVLKKRFYINGNKEKLKTTLYKLHQ